MFEEMIGDFFYAKYIFFSATFSIFYDHYCSADVSIVKPSDIITLYLCDVIGLLEN